MIIVKTAPRRLDKFRSRTLGCRHLTRCWGLAELHKETVRCVAKRTLIFIHPPTVTGGVVAESSLCRGVGDNLLVTVTATGSNQVGQLGHRPDPIEVVVMET